jgi:hypothetical protein
VILGFVIAQLADLLSFLVAVITYPHLASHEIAPIGIIYERFGVPGAIIFKVGLVLGIVWALRKAGKIHPRGAVVVAGFGMALGLLGTAFNTVAFWSMRVGV